MSTPKHPMQPIILDDDGVPRFKANPIIRFLLDMGPFDLNKLNIVAGTANWTREDLSQFYQLIGYSVSGFGEISGLPRTDVTAADKEADRLKGRTK